MKVDTHRGGKELLTEKNMVFPSLILSKIVLKLYCIKFNYTVINTPLMVRPFRWEYLNKKLRNVGYGVEKAEWTKVNLKKHLRNVTLMVFVTRFNSPHLGTHLRWA